ncbi:dinuclear metal center protein, YbgI/SA1388 family [Cruoricaptor ignavus]|uniref:GTP cyclohydrolase 1 type 2 homolog n=1 Tax=Cruoricaptor ignavus TaxID=1118202 RepID=A0A1M6EB77_9FLAO|nr:Nif3-like dinuclear metal center hexameric protein [Cruoricaptor ignavus]SHI82756.1 dinuclear metal center protein, YbgI/SA1388 family [Cruoricaptor ignavus]
MTIRDFSGWLDEKFSIRQAEDFDNAGLLCGKADREIRAVLICHDALESVVDEALQKDANFILCFHPIIFSGIKSLTGKNYVEKAVMRAIENKVAIYAVHTAFDNDYWGVNFEICEKLGLENQKILMPKKENLQQIVVHTPKDAVEKVKQAAFDAGAGNIGFYDECSFKVSGDGTFRPLPGSDPTTGDIGEREESAEDMLFFIFEKFKQNKILNALKAVHPYEEVAYQIYQLENENQYSGLGRYGDFAEEISAEDFLQKVKETFGLKVIRHSENFGKKIKRVGVLGGSGASGISAAKAAGCDAYLTGDLKYHDFFQAEGRLLLCDIGHFESEQWVKLQLFKILSEKFSNFAVLQSEVDTNPVKYYL